MNNNNINDPHGNKLDNFTESSIEHGRAIAQALLAAYDDAQAEIGNRQVSACGNLPMFWPQGITGEIAKAIYCASYLPQQEVAIIATLALLSGIAGRAYRTPTDATLAQYYLLVAHTGSGKDAIHKVIPQVIQMTEVTQAKQFVVSERFVSAPALHRRILEQPGFLSLHPEFGRRLAIIASPKANGGHDQQFADKLTEAYEKEHMEGIYRSKEEDCISGVEWPALSFLGETTPQTFNRSLTTEMMENGFFSRFLTIRVTSERPISNQNAKLDLHGEPLVSLYQLTRKSIEINNSPKLEPIHVQYKDCSSKERFDYFEEECRKKINSANIKDDMFGSAAWNRAHLKALKIASLLAVADNCHEPIIHLGHAIWAIDLVKKDAQIFMKQVESGSIGDGDDVRQKKVLEICGKVLLNKIKDKNTKLFPYGIVTRRVLQSNTSRLAPFKNHPLKASKALNETIKSLIKMGCLMEVDKHSAVKLYGEHGDCYRVLDLDDHS